MGYALRISLRKQWMSIWTQFLYVRERLEGMCRRCTFWNEVRERGGGVDLLCILTRSGVGTHK